MTKDVALCSFFKNGGCDCGNVHVLKIPPVGDLDARSLRCFPVGVKALRIRKEEKFCVCVNSA